MAEAHEAHYDIGNGLIRCEMTWTNRIEEEASSPIRVESWRCGHDEARVSAGLELVRSVWSSCRA